MNTDKSVFLLIDVQKGLDHSTYYGDARSNPGAEKNMQLLLNNWRERKWPVIHIKHNSENPDSPLFPGKEGNEIKDEVKPLQHELIFEKKVNSAFIGTGLEDELKSLGIGSLVLAVLTVEHCVSSTARMASDLGFEVTVVADATAAFTKVNAAGKIFNADDVHEISLAALENEFARILNTDQIS
ncbi:MAG: cysteine hydrolase family protein [Cyclobacteriaceae bacterium]